ncbi:MAG: cation-translocating P-type ATPase [Clostridiales bacterium]|nr:cation-translocating P-type ATPase [Clostridiales bacterium]
MEDKNLTTTEGKQAVTANRLLAKLKKNMDSAEPPLGIPVTSREAARFRQAETDDLSRDEQTEQPFRSERFTEPSDADRQTAQADIADIYEYAQQRKEDIDQETTLPPYATDAADQDTPASDDNFAHNEPAQYARHYEAYTDSGTEDYETGSDYDYQPLSIQPAEQPDDDYSGIIRSGRGLNGPFILKPQHYRTASAPAPEAIGNTYFYRFRLAYPPIQDAEPELVILDIPEQKGKKKKRRDKMRELHESIDNAETYAKSLSSESAARFQTDFTDPANNETRVFAAPGVSEVSSIPGSMDERRAEFERLIREHNEKHPPVDEHGHDQTDLDLMAAFEMQEELNQALGTEGARKLEEEADMIGEEFTRKPKREKKREEEKPAFEFTEPGQIRGLLRAYRQRYQRTMVRTLICFIFLIVAFVYENITIFGGKLPSILDPKVYPAIHVLIDMQIFVLSAALIWRQLLSGFKGLLKRRPQTQSLTAVLCGATLLYQIVMCFNHVTPELKMYSFPVVFCILLTIISEFFDIRREMFSFRIAASRQMKYTLDKADIADAELEREAFEGYVAFDTMLLRVNRVGFIDDFYKRMYEYPHYKLVLNILIPLAIVVSIIFLAAGVFITGSVFDGITVGFITLLMAMPISALITYSYPLLSASSRAYGIDSAIIGEAALEQYTGSAAVSFDDREVFPTEGMKIQNIIADRSIGVDDIFYLAACVFDQIGGPLADVLEIATLDMPKHEQTEIVGVEPDGIAAVVGNRRVLLGKADFMRRNDIVPYNAHEDEGFESGGDTSVMYMAVGESFAAKLFCRYIIDEDFKAVLSQLYKAGMCVGIKTFDPNINVRMLASHINISKYPVRVINCRSSDDKMEIRERGSSGIISKDKIKSLLQVIPLCDRVLSAIKTNLVIKVFAMIVGLIITAFVLILGMTPSMYSIYPVLFHLFWLIVMSLLAKLFI